MPARRQQSKTGSSGRKQDEADERQPLLQDEARNADSDVEIVDFSKGDPENPRNWTDRRKYMNVFVIGLMAVLSPLASSSFAPSIKQISSDLNTEPSSIFGATTGYVITLGVGPLLLAPLSETVGRKKIYITCFLIFSLMQIPTGFSNNVATLIAMRTITGFFGAAGIANGGGSISDMFDPSRRSTVLGIYLLGPLLGPTIGPVLGGLIVDRLSWRWNFWIISILGLTNTLLAFFFLKETYAATILETRRDHLLAEGKKARVKDQSDDSLALKIRKSSTRPLRILFTQPIIFIMSLYQAITFGTVFILFLNYETIFSAEPYHLSSTQIGLLFLIPGAGYLFSILVLIPRIDTIYNYMTKQNNGQAKPEFRLPLANIGALFIPSSLLVFGWMIEKKLPFYIPCITTFFFGIGQICITNPIQNYAIDAFPYAASSVAAISLFRSLVSGIIPLIAPPLFNKLGYGWGFTVFASVTALLAPAPLLFQKYGADLRERFEIDLS